jgi:hypothetical protein
MPAHTGRTVVVTWNDGRVERFTGAKDGFVLSMRNPKWQDVSAIMFLFDHTKVGTVYFDKK